MAVVRTLGKNTLGDNNKMKVAMRDYDMSTHDISTVFRSTIGVGMLVPFWKIGVKNLRNTEKETTQKHFSEVLNEPTTID